jgi:hypothetical protein
MKLTSLVAAAAALVFTSVAAVPAEAQPVRERTVVKTTVVERGHHRGWNRGRHMGWRNHHRKVCRVTVRRHSRHRVCTWR